METCTLPIHFRLNYCNLSEASVIVLANSLLTNSSLIGFTCLFQDTNDAAQSLENVVIKICQKMFQSIQGRKPTNCKNVSGLVENLKRQNTYYLSNKCVRSSGELETPE